MFVSKHYLQIFHFCLSYMNLDVWDHCCSNIEVSLFSYDSNWTSSDQSGAVPLQFVRPNDVNRQYRKDQNLNKVTVGRMKLHWVLWKTLTCCWWFIYYLKRRLFISLFKLNSVPLAGRDSDTSQMPWKALWQLLVC